MGTTTNSPPSSIKGKNRPLLRLWIFQELEILARATSDRKSKTVSRLMRVEWNAIRRVGAIPNHHGPATVTYAPATREGRGGWQRDHYRSVAHQ